MSPRSVRLASLFLTITFLLGAAAPAFAQTADTTRPRTAPNTDLPLVPTRPLKFTTAVQIVPDTLPFPKYVPKR